MSGLPGSGTQLHNYFDLIVNSDPRVAFDILHPAVMNAIEKMERSQRRSHHADANDDDDDDDEEEGEGEGEGEDGDEYGEGGGDCLMGAAAVSAKTNEEATAIVVNNDVRACFVIPTHQSVLDTRHVHQPDLAGMEAFNSQKNHHLAHQVLGPALMHEVQKFGLQKRRRNEVEGVEEEDQSTE